MNNQFLVCKDCVKSKFWDCCTSPLTILTVFYDAVNSFTALTYRKPVRAIWTYWNSHGSLLTAEMNWTTLKLFKNELPQWRAINTRGMRSRAMWPAHRNECMKLVVGNLPICSWTVVSCERFIYSRESINYFVSKWIKPRSQTRLSLQNSVICC